MQKPTNKMPIKVKHWKPHIQTKNESMFLYEAVLGKQHHVIGRDWILSKCRTENEADHNYGIRRTIEIDKKVAKKFKQGHGHVK